MTLVLVVASIWYLSVTHKDQPSPTEAALCRLRPPMASRARLPTTIKPANAQNTLRI